MRKNSQVKLSEKTSRERKQKLTSSGHKNNGPNRLERFPFVKDVPCNFVGAIVKKNGAR